jgi:FAD/FMN-containing dehydrogenase
MHLTKGPVCNALISADVMLSSGEVVTASEDSHPDLFWALRGCGPAFFGVLTRVTLPLFDPPGAWMASTYRFSYDALPELIEFFDRHEAQQDARVSNRISLGPHPDNPADVIVTARVSAFADSGPAAVAQARELLGYYSDAGLGSSALEVSEFNEQNVSAYMMTTDPTAGTHTDNVFTDAASALLAAAQLMHERPEGFSIHLDLAHNMQYHAPYGDHIAYSAPGRHFLTTYVDWTDTTPERNALAYEWADRFAEVAAQHGTGNYLNQVDTGIYPAKVRQSFSTANWERLQRVRERYDPEGRFFSYVGLA